MEALILLGFTAMNELVVQKGATISDVQALLLCAAMGLQNSLVTRLSGAVVRTTHLTGIVTDIGIESARWFRWWRADLGERTNVRLLVGAIPAARPEKEKISLLLTIFLAFVGGGLGGAVLAVNEQRFALVAPICLLLVGAVVAFRDGATSPPR